MAEFYTCSKCEKVLIEKQTSGIWSFRFGEVLNIGESIPIALPVGKECRVVEMQIVGLVRMRCTRRSCRRKHPEHWNEFNVFEINQAPA